MEEIRKNQTAEESIAELEEENRILKQERSNLEIEKENLREANRLLIEQVEAGAFDRFMTKLLNKDVFTYRLGDYFLRPEKHEGETEKRKGEFENPKGCLIILDLDHFKNINDTYGHPMGDTVLKSVENVIDESIREYDFAGRLGGEEFGVVLNKASLSEAVTKAKIIQQKISELKFTSDQDVEFGITISAGVAHSEDFENEKDFYRAADTALYKSKETRNAVTAHSDLPKK